MKILFHWPKKSAVEAIGQNRPGGTIHMVATTTLLQSRSRPRTGPYDRPHEQDAGDKPYHTNFSKKLNVEIVGVRMAIIGAKTV